LDHSEDGSEQSKEGGNVADGSEHRDSLVDERSDLEHGIFDGGRDVSLRLVGTSETRLDDASECGLVGGVAQLDCAVDVVGHHQLLNLVEELTSVDVETEEQKDEALDHHTDAEDGAQTDGVHEGATILVELGEITHDW